MAHIEKQAGELQEQLVGQLRQQQAAGKAQQDQCAES